MFKTAPKLDIRNPQRNTYTPISKFNRRVKLTLNQPPIQQQQTVGRLSQLRPMTTPIVQPKQFSTLQQTTHNSHYVNMKSIGAVQTELEQTYRGEMCGYLKNKLRRLVEKRKEEISYNRYLEQTINNDTDSTIKSSIVGPLDHFYSTFRRPSPLKIEKGIEEVYLSNAKQRISRLIEINRESQNNFNELKGSLKTVMLHRDERRGKSNREHFRVASVDEQQWDRQWRQQSKKQGKRYRNRLMSRHSRNMMTLTVK